MTNEERRERREARRRKAANLLGLYLEDLLLLAPLPINEQYRQAYNSVTQMEG